MNVWERFLAWSSFQPVDRVPRRAGYTPALQETLTEHLGASPGEVFETDEGWGAKLRPPDDYEAPDYTVYHREHLDKDGFYIDENGCGHLSHGFYHFTEYLSPLADSDSMADIEAYPFISNEGWLDDEMRAAADKAHANGRHASVFVGHMYENAWQVRGYEPFLMDLLTRREAAETILDVYCENNLRTAVAAAKCDYDLIMCGDDVANQDAMMFQPQLWREVMKPRWAKVLAAAKAIKPELRIWYHSDGNLEVILDDLVEIGVDILNPVQPECMDANAIRKRFGKRLAFDGCVGTQTTFPFGSKADMHARVRELVSDLDALQGGLMLSPTHVLEPEVPVDNIVAFFEACDQASTRG